MSVQSVPGNASKTTLPPALLGGAALRIALATILAVSGLPMDTRSRRPPKIHGKALRHASELKGGRAVSEGGPEAYPREKAGILEHRRRMTNILVLEGGGTAT